MFVARSSAGEAPGVKIESHSCSAKEGMLRACVCVCAPRLGLVAGCVVLCCGGGGAVDGVRESGVGWWWLSSRLMPRLKIPKLHKNTF